MASTSTGPSGSGSGLNLTRRGAAVEDLSMVSVTDGDLTIDQAVTQGLLTANAVHQVGIATATENRLDPARYPIRVVIGAPPEANEQFVTSFGYWSVMKADNTRIPFARRSAVPDLQAANLRKAIADMDDIWWDFINTKMSAVPAVNLQIGQTPAMTEHLTAIQTNIALPNMNEAQLNACRTAFDALMTICGTANRYPSIRLVDDVIIHGKPIGIRHPLINTINPNMSRDLVAGKEAALMVLVNFAKLRQAYATAKTGVLTVAAWTTAMVFKLGIHESQEHKEYVTLYVNPTDKDHYTITSREAGAGYVWPETLAVGTVLDVTTIKWNSKMSEFGNLLIFTSGLMHYLFNHTTGGNRITGPLVTVLHIIKIVQNGMPAQEVDDITRIMYETLHPVGKRATANLLFSNSRVYSHCKSTHARPYVPLKLDTFASIRKNPFPAGSHKAFTLVTGLRRVLQAGLAPFLSWGPSVPQVIQMCGDILNSGARAHVGAHYYTGTHPTSQASSLDNYLPEIAQYIQVFHKTDSLAMSPHLSIEVASRAPANWTGMLKSLRGKDLADAKVEKIQQFLGSSGTDMYRIDLEDDSTWGTAIDTNKSNLDAIERVFTA